MATSATEFPLGVYAGNPNGNDSSAEASFENQYNSFVSTTGASPQFMDAFTDYTQDPSQWASNASWTAWSWAQSPDASSLTPVIGVPMSDNNYSSDPDQFFQAISAGTFDADYKGIVDAWAAQGFKTLPLRLGYEMNVPADSPWYMGNNPSAIADWVAAFQHLSTLLKAQGAADGVNVKIVWNPVESSQGDTAQQVLSSYPGNQYVDVIGTDVYSPVSPESLYDWADNNGTYDLSLSQWFSNPVNREHYWSYPGATPSDPTDQSGVGWSLQDAVQLAEETGKPIAVPETGAGGSGTYGPTDDPAFPAWLASELSQPGGPQVAFVNIWDTSGSNGDWDFSSSGADKAQEAAAWARYFGAASAGATSSNPAVVQNGSDSAAIQANAPNSVLNFTDTSGDQMTMPAISSGSQNWYSYQTGLNDNVYQWVDGSGVVNVAAASPGLVETASLADTTGRSFQFYNFPQTDANLTGASTAAGAASTLTISGAEGGTITLGSGNYDVTFNADNAGSSASSNTVQFTAGSGNDDFTLNGYAGITQATINAGSGNDVMAFLNTGPVTASAGSGADTFALAPGDGALTIKNFSVQQDSLQLSAALQPDLQETNSGSGMVLSFGGSASDITLPGVNSLPSSAIHWT